MCKEYEVVKAFNIVDLYKLNERIRYCKWFQEFLEEEVYYGRDTTLPFSNFEQVKCSRVLMQHLDDLERYGLIKEKEKTIELKVGMKLKNSVWNVVVIRNSHNSYSLLIIDGVHKYRVLDFKDFPYTFKFRTTLNELNTMYVYRERNGDFEVVDER